MRNDQIFLLVCLGYIGGVFVGSFFIFVWWIFLLAMAVLLALAMVFPTWKLSVLFAPAIFFASGIFSTTFALDHYRISNLHPGVVSGIVRVVGEPEDKSFYKQVTVQFSSCTSVLCPEEKILWQAPRIAEVAIGTVLRFSCALEVPKNFDPEFDYRMYLAKDGVAYLCAKAVQAEILPPDRWTRFARYFFLPKQSLETALSKSMPQPEAGLALGLIIGGDNRLPETLKQSFVTAGLTHIVAVSGYNIALIAQGFVIVGIAIGLWRRQALWFAIIGIILFIVLIGAPASAVRAGVMGCSAFLGLFFGRLSRGINMLLLAGAGMLTLEPLLLRYDVGFQLSFLATLAIVVASPFIHQWLPKEFFGKSVIEIALLTFAVELFVVPLIIYQFHIFSVYALLTNVLLLPLVPYAMATASLAALCFLLLPGLHILPASVAYGVLRVITYGVEHLSVVPNARLDMSLPSTALMLWYALLFLGIVGLQKYCARHYVEEKNIS